MNPLPGGAARDSDCATFLVVKDVSQAHGQDPFLNLLRDIVSKILDESSITLNLDVLLSINPLTICSSYSE